MKSAILLSALLAARLASADAVPAPADAALPSMVPDPNPSTVATPEPEAAAPPTALDRRKGFHLGVGAGAIYVPETGASGVLLRVNINLSDGRHDVRLSPVYYHVTTSDQTSDGAGLGAERRWNFAHRYSVSFGAMIGVHHAQFAKSGNSYTTLGLALVGSPLTIRLGSKQNLDLGLDVMILREFEYGSVNPGAFVSLSYLSL